MFSIAHLLGLAVFGLAGLLAMIGLADCVAILRRVAGAAQGNKDSPRKAATWQKAPAPLSLAQTSRAGATSG